MLPLLFMLSMTVWQSDAFTVSTRVPPMPKTSNQKVARLSVKHQPRWVSLRENQNQNLFKSSTSLLASTSGAASTMSAMDRFRKASAIFCNLFPVWTLLTAGSALYKPAIFDSIDPKSFTGLIGALMLCMGITLKPSDFQRVLQRPMAVALAFVGCYVVMPALALILSHVFNLGPSLSAGLVLVSCINGAQASNLCTYIGQGDLALSVLMTTMTTMGAIVMTPTVGKLLLGKVVPVDSLAIAKSTVQVVLAPIILGMVSQQSEQNDGCLASLEIQCHCMK